MLVFTLVLVFTLHPCACVHSLILCSCSRSTLVLMFMSLVQVTGPMSRKNYENIDITLDMLHRAGVVVSTNMR